MKHIYNKETLPIINKELKRIGGLLFMDEFKSIMESDTRDIERFIKGYSLNAKIVTAVSILTRDGNMDLTRILIKHDLVIDRDNYEVQELKEAIENSSPKNVDKDFYRKAIIDKILSLGKEIYRNIRVNSYFENDVFLELEMDNFNSQE